MKPKHNKSAPEVNIEMIRDVSQTLHRVTDLSDIGNEIGRAIGKFVDEKACGWSKDDFIHGIEHGIALGKKGKRGKNG